LCVGVLRAVRAGVMFRGVSGRAFVVIQVENETPETTAVLLIFR
jgi:hypothetical protein